MSSNMTVYISPENHDIEFNEDGELKLVYDKEAITQCVRVTLEVYKGEFPLDTEHGVDYEKIMGKKGIAHEVVAEIMREGAYQEKRIKRVSRVESRLGEKYVSAELDTLTTDGDLVSITTKKSG